MTTAVETQDWTSQPVRIHCDPELGEEWRVRDGWVHADAPGLAVTPREDFSDGPSRHEYVVTHVSTGFRVGQMWTFEEAKLRCLMLGILGVGDLDVAGIKAKSKAWKQLGAWVRNAPLDSIRSPTGQRAGDSNG